MIAYYLDRGHSLEYLMNLGYYEKIIFQASMFKNKVEDMDEKIALNPFLKKK